MLYILLILQLSTWVFLYIITKLILDKLTPTMETLKGKPANETDHSVSDVILHINRAPKVLFDYRVKDVLKMMRNMELYTLPVYDRASEQVKCIVSLQDIYDKDPDLDIKSIKLNMPTFVYFHHSSKTILKQIAEAGIDMGVVIDEYGTVQGIVYIKDLLTRVLCDSDSIDVINDGAIFEGEDHTTLVRGDATLYQLNNILDINLHNPNYNTLNGIVIYNLNKFPEVGDVVTFDKYTCEVLEVEDLCVKLARLTMNEE